MDIGLLGTGGMGRTQAIRLTEAGHAVATRVMLWATLRGVQGTRASRLRIVRG